MVVLSTGVRASVPPGDSGEVKNCLQKVAQARLKTFGFEVEYVPHESPKLWDFYRPENLSDSDWLDMSSEERDKYAADHKAELAPIKREPSKMIKTLVAPKFLPDRLIVDETDNWEIIGPVSGSYGELEAQIKTLEMLVGPGSYQAHVVNNDMGGLEIGVAGYTLFSSDLLAFRKLVSQLGRYEKDSKQVPGAFLTHSFLSVFSKVKQEMLLAVVKANLAGKAWNVVVPHFSQTYPDLHEAWREDRPYYKYTLANTYRTDIYGNGPGGPVRWGFEVRSAHKNLDALLVEVRAIARLMTAGFGGFERFATVPATDVKAFAASFPQGVVKMARAVIAEGEADDPKPNYLMLLQRPWEAYVPLLDLSEAEAKALQTEILKARTKALEALQSLAVEHAAKAIDDAEAKKQIMVTIARFASESTLLPAWEKYLEGQLGADFMKKEKAKASAKAAPVKKEKAS